MSQNKQQSPGELINTVRQLKGEVKSLRKPRNKTLRTVNRRKKLAARNMRLSKSVVPAAYSYRVNANNRDKLEFTKTEPLSFQTLRTGKSRMTSLAGVCRIPTDQALTDPNHAEGFISDIFGAALDLTMPAAKLLSQIGVKFVKGGFKEVCLSYVPSCSSTTIGQIAMGFQPDPADELPIDIEGVKSLPYSATGSVYGPLTMRIPKKCLQGLKFNQSAGSINDRFVGSTIDKTAARQQQFGRIVVAYPKNDGTGTIADGTVHMNYTASLQDPTINASGGGTPSDVFWAEYLGVSAEIGTTGNYDMPTITSNSYFGNVNTHIGPYSGNFWFASQDCWMTLRITSEEDYEVPQSLHVGGVYESLKYHGDGYQYVAEVFLPVSSGDTMHFYHANGGTLADYEVEVMVEPLNREFSTALSSASELMISYPRALYCPYAGINFVQNTDTQLYDSPDANILKAMIINVAKTRVSAPNRGWFNVTLYVDQPAITPVVYGYNDGSPQAPDTTAQVAAGVAMFYWRQIKFDVDWDRSAGQNWFSIRNTAATVNGVSGFISISQIKGSVHNVIV
jgi:hypothetical protein